MVLEIVKQFCIEKLVDEDTQSVLLTGSWARGDGTDVNDIDIIIIKQFQLVDMHNYHEEKRNSTLDIWQYDKDSFIHGCVRMRESQPLSLMIPNTGTS